MHPELFTLPVVGTSIKTYGFFLMIGFLTAVWMTMRRAQRVKADPDVLLDASFFALLFGVIGARIFYVYHYWQSQFAGRSDRIKAVIDITEGGLEFLGGLLGGMIAIVAVLAWKKKSLRLYLDIAAPGVMWGLALGRMGCFFNGCCFGGVCADPASHQPHHAWAVRFPFGSPAHVRQWEERQVTVPAELIATAERLLQPTLLPSHYFSMSVEQREAPTRRYVDTKKALEAAKAASADEQEVKRLEAAMNAAQKAREKHEVELSLLRYAQSFPSRAVPSRISSVSEIEQLAARHRSLPVHPVQLYATINALLLSGLLTAVFYHRKRHGVVSGLMLVLYPIGRFLLETIRTDNPRDVFGLTTSQAVCAAMFAFGVVYLWVLYARLPLRSPALANEPPPAVA